MKSYIKKLPSMLKKDYRKSKRYTPKQVKSTIERGYLSVRVGAYFIKSHSESVITLIYALYVLMPIEIKPKNTECLHDRHLLTFLQSVLSPCTIDVL
ncbi:hypothetical protein [Photobacterium arenosum]|uniref:hypothetical protein n=1 Tax=Photobacterium arenosum TaxID=2774143 RepID=UPI003AF6CCA5